MFGDEAYAKLASHLGSWLEDDEELDEELPRTVKRVPLSALKDWFVPCISLVKQGQVPKAKIIAMKSKLDAQGNELAPADVVIDAFRDGLGITTAEAEEVLRAIVTVARGMASTPDEEDEEAAVATKSGEAPIRDHKGLRVNKPFGLDPTGPERSERDSLGRQKHKRHDPRRTRRS